MNSRRARALVVVAAAALLGCSGCTTQVPTNGPLQTTSHVGSTSCESALGDPNARFILAETFTNSGTAPVTITSGEFEKTANAAHLGAAVTLGHTETVNSWRLPFGSDQPELEKLWSERSAAVGQKVSPGDSLQIALPIALKASERSASAGPIEIGYTYSGKSFQALGVADLKLRANKC